MASISRRIACALIVSSVPVAASFADSTLQYQVSGEKALQSLFVKDGQVLIKSAGGDSNLDILFNRSRNAAFLIDHRKQAYMPVTEQRVAELASQVQDVQPLLRGLGEQLKKVSPEQKAKWSDMLGGVDLDRVTAKSEDHRPITLSPAGAAKTQGGIACSKVELRQGGDKKGDICLASAEALKLAVGDYETLRAMLIFSSRIADQAKGAATRYVDLGPLPAVNLSDYPGIPVELHDASSRQAATMTLSKISSDALSAGVVGIPEGYSAKKLKLW
ncbi:hypothetical protein [Methylococcus geothermalis]|uniref:DUF4412 domain-containing protein n=1 Tax=Methylococcus geothermalis TaxID=2681310 RepID=A0A858QAI9_9GAMM|nr:hypothetical protein [Methylococcus geothermalis]QJD30850.1 hypothetical protein GNH96_13325 [Methylococcus geothermalis]